MAPFHAASRFARPAILLFALLAWRAAAVIPPAGAPSSTTCFSSSDAAISTALAPSALLTLALLFCAQQARGPFSVARGGVPPLLLSLLALAPSADALGVYYTVSPFAGGGADGSTPGTADGVGSNALFSAPKGLAIDTLGNLYAVDSSVHTMRKISPDRTVQTLAGGGMGVADGVGTDASFFSPTGVAVTSAGVGFVTDASNRVRKVAPDATVTTFAGGGADLSSFGQENGEGTNALFNSPFGVAVDSGGSVYVADYSNHVVRKLSPSSTVTTFAGGGASGIQNGTADGEGTNALFVNPSGIAVNSLGTVFVFDLSFRVRAISPSGLTSTLAGGGVDGMSSGYADGVGSNALFRVKENENDCTFIAVDSAGYVFVADSGTAVVRVVSPSGLVTTLDGTFSAPRGIAVDVMTNNVFVIDSDSRTLFMLTAHNHCPAGSYCVNNRLLTCPSGAFCPVNSTAPTPCAEGTFNPDTGAASCAACAAGSYCPSATTKVLCPTGAYCPPSSVAPISCAGSSTTLYAGAAASSTCVAPSQSSSSSSSLSGSSGSPGSPGASCASDAVCASSACRGGFCCSNSSALLGCSACSPVNGACVTVNRGDACTSPSDCGTDACLGGCCCSLAAAQTAGCTACQCAANASMASAAGSCIAPTKSASVVTTELPCTNATSVNASIAFSRVVAFPASANVSTASAPLVFLPAASPLNTFGVDIIVASESACAAFTANAAASTCSTSAYALPEGTYYYLGPAAALSMTAAPACGA